MNFISVSSFMDDFEKSFYLISVEVYMLCISNLAYSKHIVTMFWNFCRYALTALYLLIIQYYTRLGGKVSIELIKNENNQSRESKSDSLVYKV